MYKEERYIVFSPLPKKLAFILHLCELRVLRPDSGHSEAVMSFTVSYKDSNGLLYAHPSVIIANSVPPRGRGMMVHPIPNRTGTGTDVR